MERLRAVERAAWEAWDRSKEPRIRTHTKTVKGTVTVTTIKEDRCGNPRYLSCVTSCAHQECKMFGLYGRS